MPLLTFDGHRRPPDLSGYDTVMSLGVTTRTSGVFAAPFFTYESRYKTLELRQLDPHDLKQQVHNIIY